MTKSTIESTIPLTRDGVHHGFLRVPYSRNDSAWGSVMVPIASIKSGDGPTALLTGGNHGDEYEGPIALQELAVGLRPSEIKGQVIIVPMMNLPAIQIGSRCSPIDDGNMNRSFPGRHDGTVTQKIAHYVATELVPLADAVLDFHSGGKTLNFLPFAAAHVLSDKTQEAACMAAMEAFNAPYSCRMLEIDNQGMFDTEVERQGKIFVTTELGGGGSATAGTIAIANKGVRNFLRHVGILSGAVEIEPSVSLDMPDESCFVFAQHSGLIEFCCDIGDDVAMGDELARIWSTERTGEEPTNYVAPRSGILAGRHAPGLLQVGDFIALIAEIQSTAPRLGDTGGI